MTNDSKNLKAIVLKSYDYGDSSRIVDVFTFEKGRLSFMAKGAKRNKSKYLNITEPFVQCSLNLVEGKNMYYIKDGVIEKARLGLRKSIHHITAATFMTELISSVLFFEEEQNLFHLLEAGLDALEVSDKEAIPKLIAAFIFKCTAFIGFRPTLSRCVECSRRIDALYFDLELGGMVCANHRKNHLVRSLKPQEYQQLVSFISQPLITFTKNEVTNADDKKSMEMGQEKVVLRKADERKLAALCLQYFQIHTELKAPPSIMLMQQLSIL